MKKLNAINYAILSRRQLMEALQVLDKDREEMEMHDTVIMEGIAWEDGNGKIQMGNTITFRLP